MRTGLIVLLCWVAWVGYLHPIFLNEKYETGYIKVSDAMGRKIFYWLFYPRQNIIPTQLIFWFSHKTICSAMQAVVKGDSGPYILRDNGTLESNPYSWNQVATVVYLDFPYGVGFSNTSNLKAVPRTLEMLLQDGATFIDRFLGQHSTLSKAPIILAGEGLAAQYLPALAQKLGSLNPQFPIKGLLIASGFWHPVSQLWSVSAYARARHLIDPIHALAADMGAFIANYALLLGSFKYSNFFANITMSIVSKHFKTNIYNVEQPAYNYSTVATFFRREEVWRELNATHDAWEFCKEELEPFMVNFLTNDSTPYVQSLLTNNVIVYTMAGKADLAANTKGQETWLKSLAYAQQSGFDNLSFSDWYTLGKKVGEYKMAKNLAYAKISNSGHFVALDQPSFALDYLTHLLLSSPSPN